TPTNTPTRTPTNTPTRTPTNTPTSQPTPTVGQAGCRITGGRNLVTANGKITGGGQVGAPCGGIGCFDSFDNIQGNWVMRRDQHRGRFKAADFNSLVCGCEACDDALQSNVKKLNGNLCNPGDRTCGPEPRRAPANLACFSGTGTWSPTGGNRDAVPVAY